MSGMTFGPFEGIKIVGGGMAFPKQKLTTQQALKSVPVGQAMSEERCSYIVSQLDAQLGLQNRHWSYTPGNPTPKDLDSAGLAKQALQSALLRAELQPEQLDLLLTATSTPHRYTGTVASEVSNQLGIHAACVDIRSGCSSGLFALAQAAFQLQAGAQLAAIVGADTFSAVLPPEHRLGVCVMGDGAAALLLGKGEGSLQAVYFETDGSLSALISTPGQMPPSQAEVERGGYRLAGHPQGFDEQIHKHYVQAIERVLEHAGTSVEQLDWFIPHQTSIPTLKKIAEHFGIPEEKVWKKGIPRHANIGAAGWMAGLCGAIEDGDIRPGQTILSASVGGGMSWGAALWTF